MGEPPRWAKAHAQPVADAYRRLGWRVASVFRVGDEPYEWLLEWVGPGPAVRPVWPPPEEADAEPGAAPDPAGM
jgi:hypothetical protein